MKPHLRTISSMNMKKRAFASIVSHAFPLLLLVFAATAFAGTSIYKLDFGTPSSPVAEGFQAAEIPSLQETLDPVFGVTDEKGRNPIEIRFKGSIGGFSLGDESKPLTTDGIYTFKKKAEEGADATAPDEPINIDFVISGFPAGSLVTFYGVNAWNGAGRAAFLSLGDSGMVDLAESTEPPAGSASPDTFVLVAAKQKAGADGKLAGVFSNSDGSKPRAEGQWGGLILLVERP